ncbi:HNH endonuclease [Rossellomorea marisflavi]|uniref:HNH endonuclease n=1 Tax=Rossellomorea marisflavi TaxID=189381 RepID=UPI00345AFF5D
MSSIFASSLVNEGLKTSETIKEIPNVEPSKDLPVTSSGIETNPSIETGEHQYLICRNESLEGDRHPLTGVEFDRNEVTLSDGTVVEGVFPNFPTVFEGKLQEVNYHDSDAKHFKEANSQLQLEIERNPSSKVEFTEDQIAQIEAGDTPEGYVWHHSEEPGVLQLVDSDLHAQTGHTGGRSIWGGGHEYR